MPDCQSSGRTLVDSGEDTEHRGVGFGEIFIIILSEAGWMFLKIFYRVYIHSDMDTPIPHTLFYGTALKDVLYQ